MGLEKVERFLELLYQYKITNNYGNMTGEPANPLVAGFINSGGVS